MVGEGERRRMSQWRRSLGEEGETKP